jgi:hypothetical protein
MKAKLTSGSVKLIAILVVATPLAAFLSNGTWH